MNAKLRDAAECAAGYLGVYFLSGLILIPVVSGIIGPSEVGDLTGFYIVAHFISAVVLWPPGALVALALQEWRGPAPWRRLWISGIVAVPVVWSGTLLCSGDRGRIASGLEAVFGSWAMPLILLGWAVLFSSLTLLITWVIPPRATKPGVG